jgi:hypothetical protein
MDLSQVLRTRVNWDSLITTNSELLSYSTPQNIKKFRSEAALLVKAWKEHDQELAQQHGREIPSHENPGAELKEGEIKALTIEMTSGNIIMRAIQPCLLLALVGYINRPHEEGDMKNRFHAEAQAQPRYPAPEDLPSLIDFANIKSSNGLPAEQVVEGERDVMQSDEQEQHIETAGDSHSSKPGTGTQSPNNHVSSSNAVEEQGSSSTEEDHALEILNLQRSKLDNMVEWLQKRLNQHNFIFREDLG